ncbi:winged helix-turn-helix transcriptional regulator [Saccharothrix coeruleofusca]|uniref:Transcriptional regulator n=1 Tax=Saccharothrix coeruleofusca TaxID=33919 RepID=A0A918AR71_9PSEU|nr:helix-turn-helix domain-containing protein [Saccharothrix coeruleofusca]MBP2335986.1 DNA-binding HxlR family transcriptional regulator [Saccharothrix coeruleofusca]GGP76177.1 transcriptional regulator [Saccharothrix coeruleofusca]
MTQVLDTLSRRWSVLVVNAVSAGYCRFNELHRHLEGINHKVLIETLYRLQRDGYLTGPLTAPPRRGNRTDAVPYELTSLGRNFRDLVHALDEWSERHEEHLTRAREDFDRLRATA